MCWAITVFGTDCSNECWNHLVVHMNASAMLPRGAAVIGARVWLRNEVQCREIRIGVKC